MPPTLPAALVRLAEMRLVVASRAGDGAGPLLDGALWTAPARRHPDAAACRLVSRPPVRPPELTGRVFRGSAVVAAGLLTPR
jgi:hypothetical protein